MQVVDRSEQLPVAEARAGNPEAWDRLFRRYQLPIFVYVQELVRDEQASLDLVQEAFITATRNIGSLREDEKFGGWLFGIAHQKILQRWRKQRLEETLREELESAPDDLADDPSELLIRREQEAEFMARINGLPPPQQAVLLLHFIEEFSLDEIAEITGTQLGTVKSRLFYAKQALRKVMEKKL